MALFNGAFNAGFSIAAPALGVVAEGLGYPAVFQIAGLGVFAGLALLLVSPEGRRAATEVRVLAEDPESQPR